MNRSLLSRTLPALLLAACASFSLSAAADADPSLSQVYETAGSGHLAQAEQMIAQVLRDHPDSAKAHYVAAELYAKDGQTGHARQEFQTAEQLAPGLPFARPDAVRALRAELSAGSGAVAAGAPVDHAVRASGFPFGLILGVGVLVAIVFMILRRRRQAYGMQYPGSGPAGGFDGYRGYPGGGYPPQGGMGSGIVGGLASGLAVGAGIVAGEEIAERLFDGGSSRPLERDAGDGGYRGDSSNSNMGGNDFGVADSGSWDDSSGGSDFGGIDSGGGDSWS